jgi:hypothetical protein
MRRLTVLAAMAAVLALPSTASALAINYAFTSDAQGWQSEHTADCNSPTRTAMAHHPTGGDPDGYISATDTAPLIGGHDGCFWIALAPNTVSGNLKANYGGTFSIDILHPAGAENGPSVIFEDVQGNQLITGSGTPPPADAWTGTPYTFTILDTPAGVWGYVPQGADLVDATKADFFEVLTDVAAVAVVGDLADTNGQVTGMDNIGLTEPGSPRDEDSDTVPNATDNCPLESGPVSNNGCPVPDGDGDGIPDASDQCPSQAGPATNNGCPIDPDGDGLIGAADKCPNESGPASNDGCPASANPGNAACDTAKAKLKKAKDKLKKLRQHDASDKQIDKAKAKVRKAKANVKKECESGRPLSRLAFR